MSEPILQVENLNTWHSAREHQGGKLVRRQVLKGVNLMIDPGEAVGLVGESGCGKATLVKALFGQVKDWSGSVSCCAPGPQAVFRSPRASLNPAHTVGWSLEEPLRAAGIEKESRRGKALAMLDRVSLTPGCYDLRPAALTLNQCRRASIALALMTGSRMLVLDEPFSEVDVTVQAQLIDLLLELRGELGMAYLLLTQDLNVVYQLCDRIAVMTGGAIVEDGYVESVYAYPKHPFTQKLLSAGLGLEGKS